MPRHVAYSMEHTQALAQIRCHLNISIPIWLEMIRLTAVAETNSGKAHGLPQKAPNQLCRATRFTVSFWQSEEWTALTDRSFWWLEERIWGQVTGAGSQFRSLSRWYRWRIEQPVVWMRLCVEGANLLNIMAVERRCLMPAPSNLLVPGKVTQGSGLRKSHLRIPWQSSTRWSSKDSESVWCESSGFSAEI